MNWESLVDGNLQRMVFGNNLQRWISSGVIMASIFLVAITVRAFAIARLRRSAPQTSSRIDDLILVLIERTQGYFLLMVAIHFGTQALELHPKIENARQYIFLFLLFLQLGFWLTSALNFYGKAYTKDTMARDAGRATTISTLVLLGDVLIWALMALLLLENYGKNISALITGLGIGGVAVALALQNILGDLFASLAIVLDKPFVIGDKIEVNGLPGTVEHIGLKTTHIRSLSGEQLIYSNSNLLGNVVRNYNRMERRRATFTIGLIYETPPRQLHKVRELVKQAVTAQPSATFERCHLSAFSASSLDFEIVYWMETSDFQTYVEAQHNLSVQLLTSFAAEGIEFAYPTQMQIEKKEPRAEPSRS